MTITCRNPDVMHPSQNSNEYVSLNTKLTRDDSLDAVFS